MDNLQKFFDGITKELNSMVRWQDDAPVAEFWELFDLAIRDVATMRAENAELRARLDKAEDTCKYWVNVAVEAEHRLEVRGQHPGFPQPDDNEPVAGTA